jgi:hypothetical protein
MQRLYKNENLLFKDFQDFLSRKQHIPENLLPYYLRWVSRYHDFCFRQDIDGDLGDAIAAYLQDLAKHYEDWQVQSSHRGWQGIVGDAASGFQCSPVLFPPSISFISLFTVRPGGNVSGHPASQGFVHGLLAQPDRLYRLCSVQRDVSPPLRTL